MQSFAEKATSWPADTIQAQLMSAAFVPTYDSATPYPNITNAQWLSDIASALIGPAITLTGKSDPAGVLVADDLIFTSVGGSVIAVAFAVFKSTGVAGTSQLLLRYDNASAGLPITPNGGNIRLFWDTGAFKIAQL